MAIYRKDHLEPYFKELETYYWNVRRALEGDAPDPSNAHFYHANPDSFSHDYRDVDMDRVEREAATVQGDGGWPKTAQEKSNQENSPGLCLIAACTLGYG